MNNELIEYTINRYGYNKELLIERLALAIEMDKQHQTTINPMSRVEIKEENENDGRNDKKDCFAEIQ